MRFLSVKNFEHYQHYKERRPPWIKLYNELLDDYAFCCLHDASKAHLLCIWLLASRHNNRLPHDAAWIARAIQATDPVNLEELLSAGFLVSSGDASDPLAHRTQDARPETEVETETETPSAPSGAARVGRKKSGPVRYEYTPEFEAFWQAYPPDGRQEKVKAFRAWERRLREGNTPEIIAAGLQRYTAHFTASGQTRAKWAATFLGPELPFLEQWAIAAVRNPGENQQQRADRVEAERKAKLAKVETRKQQRDGDEWWLRIRRAAVERGITKPGELYDYAYQQLA